MRLLLHWRAPAAPAAHSPPRVRCSCCTACPHCSCSTCGGVGWGKRQVAHSLVASYTLRRCPAPAPLTHAVCCCFHTAHCKREQRTQPQPAHQVASSSSTVSGARRRHFWHASHCTHTSSLMRLAPGGRAAAWGRDEGADGHAAWALTRGNAADGHMQLPTVAARMHELMVLVCVGACVHVCVHVCVHAHTHACTHARARAPTREHHHLGG